MSTQTTSPTTRQQYQMLAFGRVSGALGFMRGAGYAALQDASAPGFYEYFVETLTSIRSVALDLPEELVNRIHAKADMALNQDAECQTAEWWQGLAADLIEAQKSLVTDAR
jgi:hypothetical protein